jgi:hypothetical protein
MQGWWKRWYIRLFDTEAEAEANLRLPCGDGVGGYSWIHHCMHDHFIFNLALGQNSQLAEPKKEAIVPPVQPDRQGSLF